MTMNIQSNQRMFTMEEEDELDPRLLKEEMRRKRITYCEKVWNQLDQLAQHILEEGVRLGIWEEGGEYWETVFAEGEKDFCVHFFAEKANYAFDLYWDSNTKEIKYHDSGDFQTYFNMMELDLDALSNLADLYDLYFH